MPKYYDHAEFRRLYDAGCADNEIARQVGCTQPNVFYWRKRHGLPPHFKQGGERSPHFHQIMAMWESGSSYGDIAKAIGISRSAVSGIIQRHA